MSPLDNTPGEDTQAAQLRQAFDRSFALSPSPATPQTEDLLTVRVAGDPYAIRLLEVREIVTGRKIVSVPTATPDFLGLAGIDGGIVPVFGLSSLLGYGPDLSPPRWMLLCGAQEPIALAFSELEACLRLPTSALFADENFQITHEKVKYASQVARTPQGVRAVINMALILATIRHRRGPHGPTKESSK